MIMSLICIIKSNTYNFFSNIATFTRKMLSKIYDPLREKEE